jgi:hypothetical protein
VISPHDQCQRETSFFDASLDLDGLNAQLGDLNMMGMGLGGVGLGHSSSSTGGGAVNRRGILSGNVREFRYQDDDDDDDVDRDYDEAEY